MKVLENYDLIKLNTFGVRALAKFFIELEDERCILELFASSIFKDNQKLFIGGGSNILFTQDFDGLVILNKLKGMSVTEKDADTVLIRSMSGESWHDLVLFAVNSQYWGIENLSLIPGTVGGAPVQNIGAYGAELKNTLESVEVYEVATGEKKVLTKDECALGYRDSVFKTAKGKYFISAVTLCLNKNPQKNLSYKVLRDHLEKNNIEVKTSKDVSDAVSDIRRSKLPDPKVTGNAGSFFKNVFTSKEKLTELLANYPEMPHFEEGGVIKIPSGWLIEQCGWKGKQEGNVGVHRKQALVLVNHGGATGTEIKMLAMRIIASVYDTFGLTLIPEVNLI